MNRIDDMVMRVAGSKPVKTKHIRLEIVDYTDDADEPAYDVNVYVDGHAVTGGNGVFSTALGTDKALRDAETFMENLVRHLVRENGGRL